MPLPAAAVVPVQDAQRARGTGGGGDVLAARVAQRGGAGAAVLVWAVPSAQLQHAVAFGDALHQRGRQGLVGARRADALLVLLPAVPRQGERPHPVTHLAFAPQCERAGPFVVHAQWHGWG